MKRYLKHPKPAKLTKKRASRIAELQSEVRTFRDALNNVTRPFRQHFRCDLTEAKVEQIMPEQRLTGSYQIVLRQVIDAGDIHMRLDDNDWVEGFARVFAREAYESAKKHLKLTR